MHDLCNVTETLCNPLMWGNRCFPEKKKLKTFVTEKRRNFPCLAYIFFPFLKKKRFRSKEGNNRTARTFYGVVNTSPDRLCRSFYGIEVTDVLTTSHSQKDQDKVSISGRDLFRHLSGKGDKCLSDSEESRKKSTLHKTLSSSSVLGHTWPHLKKNVALTAHNE